MKGRIKLRHIEVFLTVATEANITRASERLHTAQPSISRTLKELEDVIGSPLFDRMPFGLVPTKAGERFWPYAKAVHTQLNEGIANARETANVEAVVIGALPNLTRNVLQKAVAKFKNAHPHILLRIETGTNAQLLQALKQGTIQLVIGRMASPEEMQGLTFESLWEEELLFAAAADHPLASVRGITPEQLDEYLVIIPSPGTGIRLELDRSLIARGFSKFSNVIETISAEFARNYVLNNPAIFVFGQGSLQKEIDEGSLARLDVDLSVSGKPVGASFDPTIELSVAVQQFLVQLRSCVAEAPSKAHTST